MEYASEFFYGLDGAASLTFLGLLLGALLIGLIPGGLTYAFRVRDLQKRLAKHIDAHQVTRQERDILQGQLERERTKVQDLSVRLRQNLSSSAGQGVELTQVKRELDIAREEALAAQISMRDREASLQKLKNKVASLQGQVAMLRTSSRPQPAPSAFDLDMIASLKTTRTKLKAMEQRVRELTADNEKLRGVGS